MPGLIIALVDVAVIHWDEVYITEDETIVVILLQSLSITNVEQFGAVERILTVLSLKEREG